MPELNKATIDLITEFEGVRLQAYADPAHGWAVPTIGIGHTSAAGPPKVFQGQTITLPEAHAILQNDLKKYAAAVDRLVKVPLNANQYGALTSFTFNLGEGNLAKSTLLKKLNAGDYAGAAAEMPKWNRAGGKILNGLTRRRLAEKELFLMPVNGSIPTSTLPPAQPSPNKPSATGWAALVAVILPLLYALGKALGLVP